MKSAKILLVEDSRSLADGLAYLLHTNGFEVECVPNIRLAEQVSSDSFFDLILLDLNLPDGNGVELARSFLASKIPVIILTARDSEADMIRGYDLGVDDYITKPFRNLELLSRIRNVLRRHNKGSNEISCGKIRINLSQNKVNYGEEELILTALEFKILLHMVENAGHTVTRESLLDVIWSNAGNIVNDNTLTVYMKRIRAKIGANVIRTIKNVGYIMEENEAK